MAGHHNRKFPSLPDQFSDISLVEFLEADSRPAFVLDILSPHSKANLQDCSYVNSTLLSANDIQSYFGNTSQSQAFWAWASTSVFSEPNKSLEFSFANWKWRRSIIKGRWSVVIATFMETLSSLGTAVSIEEDAILKESSHDTSLVSNGQTVAEHHTDWTKDIPPPDLPRHWQNARAVDWSKTELGPMKTWPRRLRQACNFLMADKRPASLLWGESHVMLYNEPFIDVLGIKHPAALGRRYVDVWPEVAEWVPALDAAKSTGTSILADDNIFFIKRKNFLEETYFTFSVIPIYDGPVVVGLSNPVQETTRMCLSERRITTLLGISERTAGARNMETFWPLAIEGMKSNQTDLPFALVHTVTLADSNSDTSSGTSESSQSRYQAASIKQVVLEGYYGLPEDHESLIKSKDFNATDGLLPYYRQAAREGVPLISNTDDHNSFGSIFSGIRCEPYGDNCRTVAICAIAPTMESDHVRAFVVLGLNPRRPYDNHHQQFIAILNRLLSSATAASMLLEETADKFERSENKFKDFADNAPIGINVFDCEGRILYANDIWYDVTQHDRTDSTAMAWMNSFYFEETLNIEEIWRKLTEEKVTVTFETRLRKPWKPPNDLIDETEEQAYTWVLCSAYPQLFQDGKVEAIVGCFMDISQQKWAEEIQRRRVEEAVEAKRLQESFIDMTSHEMRNPLSAILHCADGIISGLVGDPTAPLSHTYLTNQDIVGSLEAARTIVDCANHQRRIVDDILTISKLDSGLLPVTPESVQIVRVVENTIRMFASELNAADMDLSLDIAQSMKEANVDWVYADPSRLTQIFINLLSNAIKFTQSEMTRQIRVRVGATPTRPSSEFLKVKFVDRKLPRLRQAPNSPKSPMAPSELSSMAFSPHNNDDSRDDANTIYLHFAVEDTGRGLTSKEMDLLFQRFSQASPRTHVRYGGSGLGLFISRELTALQGGEIGVSSVSGQGSTFAFYIKSRRASPAQETPDLAHLAKVTSATASPVSGPKPLIPKQGPIIPIQASSSSSQMFSAPDTNGAPNRFPVLIVEDNLINRQVLSHQLRQLGFTIIEANHGEEALDILQKSTLWVSEATLPEGPDIAVILMDVEMPVMDGLECMRRIRNLEANGKISKHIPTIACTANARREQIDTAMAAGMDAVLSKPFRIPQLVSKMEELVKSKQEIP